MPSISRVLRPGRRTAARIFAASSRSPLRAPALFVLMALSVFGTMLSGARPADAADSAVILMYQRFDEPNQPTSISAASFAAHLNELSDSRYHVMSLPAVIAAFRAGTPLPDRTIVITLDDAYRSAFQTAVPLLQEHKFPYTLFVTTDNVDEGRPDMMSWEQIRRAAEAGATIGSHGARLLHMVEMGDAANRDNISRATARIAEEIGNAPTVFAYPYGEFGNAEQKIVATMGFAGAVGEYSGVASTDSTPYDLPRFGFVEAYAGIDRFRTIANALPLPVADLLPGNPKLAANPPALGFTLTTKVEGADALTCQPSFAGGTTDVEHLGDRVEVRFDKPFPAGNNKVSCTARSADNRVRWLGVPVYVPKK